MENISESVHELSNLAHFKSVEPTVSPQKTHRGSIKPVSEGDSDHAVITIHGTSPDSPGNETRKAPKLG